MAFNWREIWSKIHMWFDKIISIFFNKRNAPIVFNQSPWNSATNTTAVWKTSSTSAVNSNGGTENCWVWGATSKVDNVVLSCKVATLDGGTIFFGFKEASRVASRFGGGVYFFGSNGKYTIYSQSTNLGLVSCTISDKLSISYDGAMYRFYKNGSPIQMRTRAQNIADGGLPDEPKVLQIYAGFAGGGCTDIYFAEIVGSKKS